MELVDTIDVDCTLGDFIKLRGLSPGMVITFQDEVVPILAGDCTPFLRPTDQDGGIGWDLKKDYGTLRVSKVDIYAVPGPGEGSLGRECSPPDFEDLY